MRRFLLLLPFVLACSSSSAAPADAPAHDGAPSSDTSSQRDEGATDDAPVSTGTAIVVGVDSEPLADQGFSLASIVVVVKVDGAVVVNETDLASAGPLFPREVRVEAPSAKPDAAVEIEVRGVMGQEDVVKRLVRTSFVPGHTKLAHVFLQTRCVTMSMLGGFFEPGPTCDAAQTCQAGKCVSPDVAPADLPEYRADWTKSPPSACGDGTASTIATNIAEGATVTLERGGQCGHHFYVDLSMSDLSQFKTITTLSAVMPNSAVTIPATAVPYTWSKAPGGACELARVRFQVDTPGHQVEEYLGQDMDLTITGKDDRQRSATVVRHVKIAGTFLNPTGRPCN